MEDNQQQNTQILRPVKIEFTEEQVEVLRNTIAKDATEPELNLFIQACISYDLDPFKKELFFAKNKKNGRVDLITSRDGYLTIVQRDPRFRGLQSMEVYSNDEFTIEYDSSGENDREMNICHKILNINPSERGDLIGAWATCRFDGRDDATVFVYLDEYKKMGYDNWKNYPSAMIQKVPESIVMKRQGGISGLVTQEEIGYTDPMQLSPPKQVENTPGDIPNEDTSAGEPEPSHRPGPKDVTDQYVKKHDDDDNDNQDKEKPPEVIQTSQGDMFIEYYVDGVHEVMRSVDTGDIKCKTCNSMECVHAEKVKAFIFNSEGGTE